MVPKPKVRQPAPLGLPVPVAATWYCLAGVSRCTVGHPDVGGDQLYAAISPDLSYMRGRLVQVCRAGSCIRVRVIDCNCQAVHAIDLYSDAFKHLAPLSAGRIWVTLLG